MLIKIIDFGFTKYPERAHYNDAGADVFLMEDLTIKAHETIKIPLGLGLEIPDGFAGFIMPKSGLSSKGLVSQMSPIDSGYRGEIHAIVTNNSSNPITINKNQKIGQIVIFPIILAEFTSKDLEERGSGAFGSSGN